MDSDGFLHRYLLNNSNKVVWKWLHYIDIYERHLHRFRGKSPVMLEIGVMGGGSLMMWKNYLGPGARIMGLDINPDCKEHEAEGIEVFIGSQDDPVILDEILSKHGAIDIVLDDGSHFMHHLRDTFAYLYERMSPNGVYIVEDLHTCYWPEYGGALHKSDTFIEIIKGKLDEINAVHTRNAVPVSDFTRSTDAICCYDSVAVFERRRQGRRQMLFTEPM